jgi:hypothetical protein
LQLERSTKLPQRQQRRPKVAFLLRLGSQPPRLGLHSMNLLQQRSSAIYFQSFRGVDYFCGNVASVPLQGPCRGATTRRYVA